MRRWQSLRLGGSLREGHLGQSTAYQTTNLRLRRFQAALLLAPRLFRASIDPALVPQCAPALLGGAKCRMRHGGNPSVAANITATYAHHFPAHGRIIHKMPRAQKTVDFSLLSESVMRFGQYAQSA